ncbi:hypothetical protein QUB60_26635 [Microcoleus sp. A2-C5]|nr:hypothetical protein [Lyngbya sp. CCAP 1446/10]
MIEKEEGRRKREEGRRKKEEDKTAVETAHSSTRAPSGFCLCRRG